MIGEESAMLDESASLKREAAGQGSLKRLSA
jgi:hypothetical protein